MEKDNQLPENERSLSGRKRTSFIEDVFKLASGTVISQVLIILSAPILTRIYSPDAFGLFALFISITGIVSIVSCLRYDFSILLPESDEVAINLLVLSLCINIGICIIAIPVIWFFGESIVSILHIPEFLPYLWLVPFTVFFSGAYLALNYWNVRTKYYNQIMIAKITNSTSTTITQIGIGIYGFVNSGLIVGSFLGSVTSFFVIGVNTWRHFHSFVRAKVRKKAIVAGLKRYYKFPVIDTWSTLLNTLSWQLPMFILAWFFSLSIVGFFSLGFRLLQVPMNFLGSSISQVFSQRAAEMKQSDNLSSLTGSIFGILLKLSFFPLVLLMLIGSDLFSVVFGEIWTEAGVYAQILAIWGIVWFISSPMHDLFLVLEDQAFTLKFNMVNFSTRFVALVIGGLLGNALIAIVLFSVFGTIVYGYICWAILIRSKTDLAVIKKVIMETLKRTFPAVLLVIVLKFLNIGSIVIVIVTSVLVILYMVFLAKKDTQVRMLIVNFRSSRNPILD
jgi:lipopolysaccharide exporter